MPSEFEKVSEAFFVTEQLSFKTRGCSMQPLFAQHRDVVNVKRASAKLKRGDVILYPSQSENELILHRIIRVNGDKLHIRGDNNYFDEYRTKDEVIGIMTSFFREGKYCDIKKSLRYKIYTFYILNSYWFRKQWRFIIKPVLVKIKRMIRGKNGL